MRRFIFPIILIHLACLLVSAVQAAAPPPNILVILADDLGYGDVQCYNPGRGKIPTPHLDKLAAQGMRFTDAHSSSGVCSPSRYTLLTGRYHWRTRLQAGIVGYLEAPLIAPDRLTLASMLKQHGYHSACIGKWHLGWDWDITPEQRPHLSPGRGKAPELTPAHLQTWQAVYSKPIRGGPTTRGFDEYFGTDVPNWPPYCFIENDRTLGIPGEFLPAPLLTNHLASIGGPALKDWRLEGILPALTRRACDFITRRSRSGQPFFLYLPLTTPHTPLAPNPEWRGKSGLDNRAADLIMETDSAVGKVLATLDASGAAGNTFVFFSSDNGFAPYVGAKDLEARGHFPSGPLRGYKADVWEGGHRVPYIIRWPGVVQPNQVCNQLAHHADLMATLAEIIGHNLPPGAGEDSFSLLPLLKGEDRPIRQHAVSHGSNGMPSLRLGPWKFIAGAEGGGNGAAAKKAKRVNKKSAPERTTKTADSATATVPPAGQLYNLADDLGETNNLYSKQPEQAAKMSALLEKIVSDGRGTPGPVQPNDVPHNWRKFLEK